jgi:hypothetical protein
MRRGNALQTHLHAFSQHTILHSPLLCLMLSPMATVIDDARPDCAAQESPLYLRSATPLRMVGSIMYNWEENGYNLEWETRADFDRWLTHEQKAVGIEIQIAKTQRSKAQQQVYLTCKTFCCAHNGCEGIKHYEKKMAQEQKIDSKWIDGGCPCYIQIKMYPNTNTILGKYEFTHSHQTGKNNLKYIWIQVSTWDLIEDWVRYGVTNEEIVSDPLCNHF